MGWVRGFEPPTSGSTIRRSNQLSYTHHRAATKSKILELKSEWYQTALSGATTSPEKRPRPSERRSLTRCN